MPRRVIMARNNNIDIFSPNQQLENLYYQAPVVSKRAPTGNDNYEYGTVWIDTVGADAYVTTGTNAAGAIWINIAGGSGSFTSVTATTGNITATLGNIVASVGNLVIGGSVTFGALTPAGVLFNSITGVVSSSTGTDGQVILGKTAGAPLWGSIAAGAGIVVTPGANALTITATGVTASTFTADAGGAVSPLAGNTNIVGGTNIGTVGTPGTNTLTFNLNPSISLAGAVTAGVNLNMTTGICTISSNSNAANGIYLNANGGAAEQINLYSQQGTSTNSVQLSSLDGGVKLISGLASINAINMSSGVTGGITANFGSAGLALAGTNGQVDITSGTGAINIGADAAAHTVTLGSTNTTAATVIQSGSGNVAVTSSGTITLDSVGVLNLNSSAGIIGIGNNAVAQNINIGTGGAARIVTIGNATAASSVVVNSGTGAASFGANATDHTTTVGSVTGVSATSIHAGTGGLALSAAGIVTVVPVTDSGAGTRTINANVGVATFTGYTTAAAASQVLTVTNSKCSATSAILCTVANNGAADAQMTITRVQPTAGAILVTVKNNGAASLADNIILTFWIIA